MVTGYLTDVGGFTPSLFVSLSGTFKLHVFGEQTGKPAAVCETRRGEGAGVPPRHRQVQTDVTGSGFRFNRV